MAVKYFVPIDDRPEDEQREFYDALSAVNDMGVGISLSDTSALTRLSDARQAGYSVLSNFASQGIGIDILENSDDPKLKGMVKDWVECSEKNPPLGKLMDGVSVDEVGGFSRVSYATEAISGLDAKVENKRMQFDELPVLQKLEVTAQLTAILNNLTEVYERPPHHSVPAVNERTSQIAARIDRLADTVDEAYDKTMAEIEF